MINHSDLYFNHSDEHNFPPWDLRRGQGTPLAYNLSTREIALRASALG